MEIFDSDNFFNYSFGMQDAGDLFIDLQQFLQIIGGPLGAPSGPPPARSDTIDNLPDASISEEQVRQSLRCSICLEDFRLHERVKCLPCAHAFHKVCIEQWLREHGTCPVCRRNLEAPESDPSNAERENAGEAMRGGRYQRTLQRDGAATSAAFRGGNGSRHEDSRYPSRRPSNDEQPPRIHNVPERGDRSPLRETESRWPERFADEEREHLSPMRASRANAHWQQQNAPGASGSAVRALPRLPVSPLARDGASAAAAGTSRVFSRAGDRYRVTAASSPSDASIRLLHRSSPTAIAPRPPSHRATAAATASSSVSASRSNRRAPSHSQQSTSQERGPSAGHSRHLPLVAQRDGAVHSFSRTNAADYTGLGAAPVPMIRSREPRFGFGFGLAAAAAATTPASMYTISTQHRGALP